MMKKAATIALLLCACLTYVHAYSACCAGDNLLTDDKKCVEGFMKNLTCSDRLMVRVEKEDIRFGEHGDVEIMDGGETYTADQYCVTSFEKKNITVLVMCYEPEQTEDTTRVINVILSFVSVVFIILTICVYALVPQLLDTQGICLMHSITGLGLSFIIMGNINLSGELAYHHCRLLAYLMYFAFLYSFFWLNILCFHIWRVIVNPKILKFTKYWKLIYHLVGIGAPALLLVVVLIANYSDLEFFQGVHPGIGEVKCWFKDLKGTLVYFYGPVSVLLCINIVYFIWTTVVLCQRMKQCSGKKAKIQKYRLLLCIKLFFVMGIPWVFEVVSAVSESHTSQWVWVLPDALNALQGLLIFLILVVFRKKVLRALANKKIFRSIKLPARWKTAQDDECEELEEELSLSTVEEKAAATPA